MHRTLALIALCVPFAMASALSQTAPPLDVVMELDRETGENRILSILVDRGGDASAYGPEAWVRPTLEGYAQAKASIIVAYGMPLGAELSAPWGTTIRENLPETPVSGEARARFITDDLANSVLLNIADDADGLALAFPGGGLVNRPGPDLVLLEASIPAGAVSGGCPGVPSSGADPVVIALPDGEGVLVGADKFLDFGPAGPQLNYGTEAMGRAEVFVASLVELTEGDYEPLAAINRFKVYATAFDLSELGLEEGDAVERIVMRSAGEMVETEVGPRLCWTADPILVVGLP